MKCSGFSTSTWDRAAYTPFGPAVGYLSVAELSAVAREVWDPNHADSP
jgi:hypothetical protein